VTTHHGTLKTVAFENPRIQNGAMEFDQGTLTPTYQFRSGVPGSSYAIEMAERIHLPADIIARSRELKGTGESKIEHLIIDLERQAQELKRTLDDATAEKARLASMMHLYESKITSLQNDLNVIKARAVDEASEIVRRANVIVEHSVKEIKESAASKEIVKHVKQELEELTREYSKLQESIATPPMVARRELAVGDTVRIRNTDSIGTIESRLDDAYFLVVIGGLKARITSENLELAQEQAPGARSGGYVDYRPEQVKKEIDLRGLYGDEALTAIDKFLDDALLAGLHRVEVIHGKGTGALRKKIAEHLKGIPAVKTFRLGEWNEGGSGVTVIELS
jgi:DNA mismatch repair protein MutS2